MSAAGVLTGSARTCNDHCMNTASAPAVIRSTEATIGQVVRTIPSWATGVETFLTGRVTAVDTFVITVRGIDHHFADVHLDSGVILSGDVALEVLS